MCGPGDVHGLLVLLVGPVVLALCPGNECSEGPASRLHSSELFPRAPVPRPRPGAEAGPSTPAWTDDLFSRG
ncbi:hypothetical protein ARZXY2_1240 [Arthrobacter sp. ZXY-2]|nr:hypothetical protein ARZXY2_1240 [Arthrobacter sp. ZXY-2]